MGLGWPTPSTNGDGVLIYCDYGDLHTQEGEHEEDEENQLLNSAHDDDDPETDFSSIHTPPPPPKSEENQDCHNTSPHAHFRDSDSSSEDIGISEGGGDEVEKNEIEESEVEENEFGGDGTSDNEEIQNT